MQEVQLDAEAAAGGDALAACEIFEAAAAANESDPTRRGSLLFWPSPGRVLMTGDLHDHQLNLRRIIKFAKLEQDPSNRVVLHEVIHGMGLINNMDLSIRTLVRTAAMRAERPTQVAVMQSNHELAQMLSEEISKGGLSVVEAFDDGVSFLFGDDAEAVQAAMVTYLRSLPLGVVLPNGIMLAHSLPGPRNIEYFDKDVVRRDLTDEDLAGGSAHAMVWGRWHNVKVWNELCEAWKDLGGVSVERFVLGHQPAEMGHERVCDGVLVLASDHDHGVALPIDTTKSYTDDELDRAIMFLGSVRVD